MRFLAPLFCVLILPSVLYAQNIVYPQAKRSEQKDDYFGTTVADPYRWMETNDTPELTAWIDAENQLSRKYFDALPIRETLKERLTDVVNYPKYSLPWQKAGKVFFSKNDGLQNQSVLYVMDTPEAEPRVLLDPNKLSEDGTVALQTTSVSKDGKFLAYSIARSGSDWNEIFVLDIATGKTLPDRLEWVKFSGIAWYGDGFYYSRYDAPKEGGDKLTTKNEFHKIYYHVVGRNQVDDRLIREDRENPLRNMRASTDRDQNFLFISDSESTYGNSLYFTYLIRTAPPSVRHVPFYLVPVVTDFRSEQSVVSVVDHGNGDSFTIYLLTDRDAPNRRLVRFSPDKPAPEHWVDVISESDTLLASVSCIGGRFVATYLKDAAHEVYVYDKDGKRIREIELPTLGMTGFSGEKDSDVFFQSFTSYTYPTVIYRGNLETGDRKEFFPTGINFNKDDYTTERVWYTNSDGKKVPIFLTYKKGLKKNGSNPTLLYGYGGFNISVRPAFSAFRIPFLEQGGIYAHAVLRGGGEYGETWHKAGTKLQKQNVFDDFAAAAEFLIKEKYTSPEKLAIQGGSNGGLLVAATMLQRPDLFRAALPAVGVLDMLRYHKFTIGWAWATDYGTSEDSKEMFDYLYKYSPLHNVKAGVNYPAMLITTSDHDDRVVPAHSFKFTAEMQHKSGGLTPPGAITPAHPVYIRIETKAGHGAGKPVSKQIDEAADVWTFIMNQLGMDVSGN
ncbi:MAG: prolyl oligopeptidase family serine peptidase [Planctomycetaceae bacterium]|nr:prolyl oligopeptidase family serine peptidase [Planctomycetaceae bacterium]